MCSKKDRVRHQTTNSCYKKTKDFQKNPTNKMFILVIALLYMLIFFYYALNIYFYVLYQILQENTVFLHAH